MDDDLTQMFEELFSKPPFRANPIVLNSDALDLREPQVSQQDFKILNSHFKKLIFDAAQIAKETSQSTAKALLENAGDDLDADLRPLLHLIFRAYSCGRVNGTVDFANTLIRAMENTEKLLQ